MGWEERGDARYYYRKERTDDGCVVSRYVGSGAIGEAVERADVGIRNLALAERRAVRRILGPIDEALAALRTLSSDVRSSVSAHLAATGHYTHKGQWRRRSRSRSHRHASQTMMNLPAKTDTKGAERKASVPARARGENPEISPSELSELVDRCKAKRAAPSDVRRLRQWLRAGGPDARRFMGEGSQTKSAVLALGGGEQSVLIREVNAQRLIDVRNAYGWQDAPPPERLQIEQIALSYLVLEEVQRGYAHALKGGLQIDLAPHYEKRLTSAQHRFNAAVESLERVRALKRKGSVYVNVAAEGGTFQQVNT